MKKINKSFYYFFVLTFLIAFSSCKEQTNAKEPVVANTEQPAESKDPLPSWNDGATKQAIVSFVNAVTDKNGADYVSPNDRIATFDNDGTLWAEQPVYAQLLFAFDRIKTLAPEHPEWKNKQPFKAVLENDQKTLMESGEKGLLEIVTITHAGMSTDDFETIVNNWITVAKQPDPRFKDRLFTEMIYQPMLELLDYLRANDFDVFIVSGGGIEFMRPWTDRVYGVPTQNVVGSSVQVAYDYNDGKPVLKRIAKIDFIDDKVGKPVGINSHIGKKPILAFGNSTGDQQMLEWSQSKGTKTFQGLVHHTDADREWAYGPDSHIGTFSDELMKKADSSGWHVVDMKTEWKVIFPSDLK
ncbi:HAD family hydrolase [Xanthomarina spongicola]|uniref:phosphoserine phosphatase n=1 Tax=Xanthomarina spongicola TaxID=570520 RepID=A0A316DRA8_9FLAO|nr:HAD family hydrolase [Xanthomarina spongicola]PWK19992.1 phosphoserine phosphatase [Xanthomarina spongicola]